MTAPIPPDVRERALNAGLGAFAIAWGAADGMSAIALAEHIVTALGDAILTAVDLPGRDARLRKAADYAREHATTPKETPDA
jgi:hypothetical protein